MVKLPKTEAYVWVSHYDSDRVLRYLTTSNKDRTRYTVFEVSDGKLTKLGSGKDPGELDRKYVRLS